MNIFLLSWRNILAKPLATALSLLLLTLGVGIISLLLLFGAQLERKFKENIQGIDMVVGAKGSPLQLILSCVYHIDNPTGNIPKAEADALLRHPLVAWGIPLSFGDNYQGYKILGTTPQYVSFYKGELAEGKLWETPMQAVLGADVAKNAHLKIGDTFFGAHGLDKNSTDIHKDAAYTVVGILKPNGSVLDMLVLTAGESIWRIHEGKENENGEVADAVMKQGLATKASTASNEEITAMLLHFRGPMGMIMLPRIINENTSMQSAVPAFEISRLFSLMGIGIDSLRILAAIIMLVAGLSVFISLYNSMRERKYELALLRVMGASRTKLLMLVLFEGILLALVGFFLGEIASRLGMYALAAYSAENYHYHFDVFSMVKTEITLGETTFEPYADVVLFVATLFVGVLAAALPAIRAFRTDISHTLADK